MKKRRILVILESRATYGYSKNVLVAMRDFPELEPLTLVTGMHLIEELGNSIDLIREDGFPISAQVPLAAADESQGAWAHALGQGIDGFAAAFEDIKPDIVLLSGDRIETLGCCLAAAYMNIPSAHVQAGDKSGHIDDISRMALAKLSHIHFASCEDSAERVRRLGEQDFRIFTVGAPQLDDMDQAESGAGALTIGEDTLALDNPYILLLQHPVMVESEDADSQMAASLKACLGAGLPVVWIYPNADFGYRRILHVIDEWKDHGDVKVLSNVERRDYLSLLANARVLVGNSSSGILEAPTYRTPVINIGNRQRGRQQASNIINSDYAEDAIAAAIAKALNDGEFQVVCAGAENPYGDGKSGRRICEILRDITIDRRLLDKETVY